ncbi:putative glycoside hydrolase [Ornithinibacillus scapharcae]|uniref:putative glycoside hydrolase n=1 Tax=Ornithinibacillus scapharcae TaxID=1147159 RepID=UPI000225BCF5|nr:putative glycoside hydrolase [Ornithinibacillus scapharcae]
MLQHNVRTKLQGGIPLFKKLISIICIALLFGCTNNQATPEVNNKPGDNINNYNTIGNNLNTTNENLDNRVRKLSSNYEDTKKVQSLDNKEERPKVQVEKPERVDVRGIYLNRTSITEENVQQYIDLIKSTNLNAAVIDVKDDYGKLTYDSNIDLANKIGSDSNPATMDLTKLIKRFKDEGIYTIARIVVFKDPYLAENQTDFAIKRKDGALWNASGIKWVDPYKKEVWNYITSIAKEVSNSGFDEIQYDYIRFPENAKKVDQEVAYDNPDGLSKADNILSFLKYSEEQLKNEPIYVSADVFGLVTTASDDMGIGQLWENISPHVDYISPMTYPSHYAPGSYGVANPDRAPYEIMLQAMKDANQRNKKLKQSGKDTAIIRPWVQDFDYISAYNAEDVRKQIQAIKDQGISQYLIWNAGNVYTTEAFK